MVCVDAGAFDVAGDNAVPYAGRDAQLVVAWYLLDLHMGGEGRVAVQYYSMQYILVLCEIKVRLLCVRLGCGLLFLFLLGVAAGVGLVLWGLLHHDPRLLLRFLGLAPRGGYVHNFLFLRRT